MRWLISFVFCVVAAGGAFAEERLIASAPERAATKDGKTTVEVASSSKSLIRFVIHFERRNGKGTTGPAESLPVVPGKWAVWIAESQDVWFYDGKSRLLHYKLTGAGTALYDNDMVPFLAEHAPESLKRWIKKYSG